MQNIIGKVNLKQWHLEYKEVSTAACNIYKEFEGNGCGSVGRAVASDTRGPRFESSHRQKFIYTLNICLLSTVY